MWFHAADKTVNGLIHRFYNFPRGFVAMFANRLSEPLETKILVAFIARLHQTVGVEH